MTNDVNWSGCIRGTGNSATTVALWRADADGCLPELSAATVSGRIWPKPPVDEPRGGACNSDIAAAGGVIATGSKGSAVAVQGSPARWRAGRTPEFGPSARLLHTQDRQYRGVLVPEVASESVPRCEACRRDWDIALPCKAALVKWADVRNRRCDSG